MAVEPPRFVKSGATGSPLDMNQGIQFPYQDGVYQPLQSSVETRGGNLQIAEWNAGNEVQRFSVQMTDNETKRDALESFLKHTNVRWSLKTFTFYPEGYQSGAGPSFTVRLVPGSYQSEEKYPSVYLITFAVRVEL